MRILNETETRGELKVLELDEPIGVGFAFNNRARDTFYDWHTHDYHQLLYAISGVTQLETGDARFLLPAGRAAWIPAGARHRTLIADTDGASLYFAPGAVPSASRDVRILVAPPVMREMILYARRWPRGASDADPIAQSYFITLALMCGEWLESELPLRLPRADHPAIVRAMDYAVADPGSATQAGAIAAAALSERTFRRLFARETGTTWQAWLTQARILGAMAQLADGARVTDAADAVGFASLSAFAKSFTQLTGETPSKFRRRARKT